MLETHYASLEKGVCQAHQGGDQGQDCHGRIRDGLPICSSSSLSAFAIIGLNRRRLPFSIPGQVRKSLEEHRSPESHEEEDGDSRRNFHGS